jgi:hypothetical protein
LRYWWITGTAAAALLVPAPAVAKPAPPEPDRMTPAVRMVEVPVDDADSEAAQMIIAAALGAAVATAAGRRRAARRSAHPAFELIDITDIVQSRPAK